MGPRSKKIVHIPFSVRQLSDAELSAELRALEQQSGPVTEETREIYQRLLVRARRAAQERDQQPVNKMRSGASGGSTQENKRK